jgi:hypothetical protein
MATPLSLPGFHRAARITQIPLSARSRPISGLKTCLDRMLKCGSEHSRLSLSMVKNVLNRRIEEGRGPMGTKGGFRAVSA